LICYLLTCIWQPIAQRSCPYIWALGLHSTNHSKHQKNNQSTGYKNSNQNPDESFYRRSLRTCFIRRGYSSWRSWARIYIRTFFAIVRRRNCITLCTLQTHFFVISITIHTLFTKRISTRKTLLYFNAIS
jgi:hypothetical protein